MVEQIKLRRCSGLKQVNDAFGADRQIWKTGQSRTSGRLLSSRTPGRIDQRRQSRKADCLGPACKKMSAIFREEMVVSGCHNQMSMRSKGPYCNVRCCVPYFLLTTSSRFRIRLVTVVHAASSQTCSFSLTTNSPTCTRSCAADGSLRKISKLR